MTEINSRFWLLTFDHFKKDVKKPEDNLIILVHWLLLHNNFQVLGPGNEKEVDENEKPIDGLPTNWFEKMTYKLRYVRNKILFILNGVQAGDSFIFNFYNVTTKHVSSASLSDINTIVQCISDIEKNENTFHETVNMLQEDLIDPILKGNDTKKECSTQTAPLFTSYNNSKEPIMPVSMANAINQRALGAYGSADLDPLAGLRNGGMLFDPLRRRNLRSSNPRFPPTARFDPIHPPNPDNGAMPDLRRPNPDHMRPPDFDDMYM